MLKMYVLYLAICLPSFGLGCGITWLLSHPTVPQVVRAPEYAPDQPPGCVVKLVGITPDGTRVYRMESVDMIVPRILAISPTGQVAFQ